MLGIWIYTTAKLIKHMDVQHVSINSLWPSDAIWWHRYGATLAQVIAWCPMAPIQYLNQNCIFISVVLWRSYKCNFAPSYYSVGWVWKLCFKITASGYWVKHVPAELLRKTKDTFAFFCLFPTLRYFRYLQSFPVDNKDPLWIERYTMAVEELDLGTKAYLAIWSESENRKTGEFYSAL